MSSIARRVSMGLILLSALGWSAIISAQWTSDPAINLPICTEIGPQWPIDIIPDGSGGAIFVWQDTSGGWDSDVCAQRVDALGFLKWGAEGITVCEAEGAQCYPKLASDGSGGAIVAWTDARAGTTDIYGQRISPSGACLWTIDGVAICTEANHQYSPCIVSDDSGGAIICWCDCRAGSFEDIYAQRLDAAGAALWPNEGIPICVANNQQLEVQCAPDGAGGAVMTWEDCRSDTSWFQHTIYTQRISSSGAVRWQVDGVPVCSTSVNQMYPQVVSDDFGGAFVVYFELSGGFYAQKVDSLGVPRWGPNGVTISSEQVVRFDTEPDGSGGLIVGWSPCRAHNRGYLYAQRLDASGAGLWTSAGVLVCSSSTYRSCPALAANGSGGAIVVWSNLPEDESDIYAQSLDGRGNLLWTADGVPVSTAPNDQGGARIVLDASGDAIVAWGDRRISICEIDIYAQKLNSDGSLGIPQSVRTTGGGWIAEHAESKHSKRTYGFNARSELGEVWGHLQFSDHDIKMNVHSDTILSLTVYGDTCAEFSGTCRVGRNDGYTFNCQVEDRGEPGHGKDKFSLDVWDPDGNLYYSVSGALGGGNIQIHTVEDEIVANLRQTSQVRSGSETEHNGSIQNTDITRESQSVLWQNSPNPFRRRTMISYSLAVSSHVTLEVFDHAGRLVEILADSRQQSEMHRVNWHANSHPTGIYFYRLRVSPEENRRAGDFTDVKKMILLR